MKIGICDDNKLEQTQYLELLENLGYENISVFSSGEEFLKKMPALDLLFLDIEMEQISGIDVKNILEENGSSTYIVFYTTHMESMSAGFGTNVLGYLHKPVTAEELKLYIDKVSMKLQRNHPILLTDNNTISSDMVLYIHSEHNYTKVHLTDGNTALVRKSLQDWAVELSEYGFISPHRSYLVNLHNIHYIDKNSLVLTNGEMLTISRQYLAQTKSAVRNYQLRLCNPHTGADV